MIINTGIILTQYGVDYISKWGLPVMAPDFIGYLVKVTKDDCCFVGIDNLVVPASMNKKKPMMTKKRIKRIFRLLYLNNIIADPDGEPFAEFSPQLGKDFNYKKAINLGIPLLQRRTDNFVADDEVNFSWEGETVDGQQ